MRCTLALLQSLENAARLTRHASGELNKSKKGIVAYELLKKKLGKQLGWTILVNLDQTSGHFWITRTRTNGTDYNQSGC